MCRRLATLSGCLLAMCLSSAWAGPAQRVPLQQSAFDVPSSPRWYVGAEGMWEGRDLYTANDSINYQAWHADAVLGVQPVSWIILQAGLGVTEASRNDIGAVDGEDVDSDTGIEWLARIRANVAEYVFTTKPGVGRHQVVRLCVSGSYRDSEANFDDPIDQRYFKWQEWLLEPYLQYAVNLLGEGNYDAMDVSSVTLRAGPAFSWINGSFDGADIDEQRQVGVAVGGDLLLACGLTLGVEARAYRDGEGTVGASLGHRF